MVYINLFLDWDGTLTKHDTILPLSRIGYQINEAKGIATRPWDEIVEAYLDDLKAHAEAYQPARESRTTIGAESKYLASVKPIEWASTDRIVEAGVFANVTSMGEEVKEALRTGEVEMRPGWERLFSFNPKDSSMVNTAIITVNWSANFIKDCMFYASTGDLFVVTLKMLPIYGNEINSLVGKFNNPRVGDLSSDRLIQTSADKLEALRSAIEVGKAQASKAKQEYMSIYVGDTATDFDCLLEADVGVCIQDVPLRGGQQELASTFARVGVDVLPLSEARNLASGHESKRKTVYSVNNLAELANFIEQELREQ